MDEGDVRTMGIRALAISSVLALCAASGVAADDNAALATVFDKPLENDGRVLDLTVFPYAGGSRGLYLICWHVCSEEFASGSPSAIEPRMPGEFDGFHGDRPVHVRVRFDAVCFTPGALCADVRYFFKELEPKRD